jgi:hypothetical protein
LPLSFTEGVALPGFFGMYLEKLLLATLPVLQSETGK